MSEGGFGAKAEGKANFSPSQPRVPRGFEWGGRWAGAGGGWGAPSRGRGMRLNHVRYQAPVWADIEVGSRSASRQTQQFLVRNQDSITRLLGGLQAFGGAAEVLGGGALVGGGVATSETGVGIAIAGAGAWMVTNGYDNFAAGWRALLTGAPQQTNLHTALRRLGLPDDQAIATEILLAGGVSAGAARLGRDALELAARAGLAQRAMHAWTHEPLIVRIGGRRIWDEPNIELRGDAWEIYDAARTGFQRTPRGFPVFDQFDEASGVAISNKTLDLVTAPYSRLDRNAVYNRLAIYIDRAAAFSYERLLPARILERRLHMLLPAAESLPGQALQIAAAERYAHSRGVILVIEFAK